jgi:hypothetical protein
MENCGGRGCADDRDGIIKNSPLLPCCAVLAMRVDLVYGEEEIETGHCCRENGQSSDWTFGRDDDAFTGEGDA